MFITPILYITLGISLGIGSCLIYLQEKFTKERRKLIALNEAEKAKSAETIKRLDTDWEEKTKVDKENLLAKTIQVQDLEKALEDGAARSANQEQEISKAPKGEAKDNNEQLIKLQEILQEKETELRELLQEKQEISETLQAAYLEVKDLHGEITFLNGEIKSLKEASAKKTPDDDFLVLGPGNHYLPGSVARNLMAKSKK